MSELIIDVGSTHGSRLNRCLESVDRLADIGIKKVKFQLFPANLSSPGNFVLPLEWMPEIIGHAREKQVSCSASVWDTAGIDMLAKCGCDWIKIAYSQRHNSLLMDHLKNKFDHIYVTATIWDPIPGNAYRLYVDEDETHAYYPSYNEIDFAGMFNFFDGYSCHCLGIRQAQIAIRNGARIIEAHGTIDRSVPCNDNKFAWDIGQIKKLVEFLKWN